MARYHLDAHIGDRLVNSTGFASKHDAECYLVQRTQDEIDAQIDALRRSLLDLDGSDDCPLRRLRVPRPTYSIKPCDMGGACLACYEAGLISEVGR